MPQGEKVVRFENMKLLVNKINKLQGSNPRLAEQASRNAARGIGQALVGELQVYPPDRPEVRKRAWSLGGGFVSDRQRRWFFLMLKNNQLQIPYRRNMSAGLAGAWYVRATRTGAVVGNSKSYAIFVQHHKYQSRIHQGSGWKTAHSPWMRAFLRKPFVMNLISGAVKDMFRRAGLGA